MYFKININNAVALIKNFFYLYHNFMKVKQKIAEKKCIKIK